MALNLMKVGMIGKLVGLVKVVKHGIFGYNGYNLAQIHTIVMKFSIKRVILS